MDWPELSNSHNVHPYVPNVLGAAELTHCVSTHLPLEYVQIIIISGNFLICGLDHGFAFVVLL